MLKIVASILLGVTTTISSVGGRTPNESPFESWRDSPITSAYVEDGDYIILHEDGSAETFRAGFYRYVDTTDHFITDGSTKGLKYIKQL